MKRLLVTGAAGALGRVLRERLPAHLAALAAQPLANPTPNAALGSGWRLRFSDLAEMAPSSDAERQSGTEFVRCDLADAAATRALHEGVDAVVHLGGRSVEGSWGELVQANLVGVINVYEAARAQGTDRVIFASSNHAIGLYPRTARIDHLASPRPDSRYGLTKAFGEDVAWLYAHKHRVRSLCLRIGSCVEKPSNARMLATWLSYGDLLRLVTMGLQADYRYDVVYGVSANRDGWWDNRRAFELGYRPQDDASLYAAELAEVRSSSAVAEAFQGGHFAAHEFEGEPKLL
jgi:uronate dehydrogenase